MQRNRASLASGMVMLLGLATVVMLVRLAWPEPEQPVGVLEPLCSAPVEVVEADRMQVRCASYVAAMCGNVAAGARVHVSDNGACDVAPNGMSAKARLLVGLKLDLNTASVAELVLLEPVGPSLAQAIIAYREAHGPFASLEGLGQVPGIGPKKLVALAAVVEVRLPQTP